MNKEKNKMRKRTLGILSAMMLTFSVSAPVTVSAFEMPDAFQEYADLGIDDVLEDLVQDLDVSEEFSVLEQALVSVMKSDWYKNADFEEKKEKIVELLADTGYINKDTAEMGMDAILNFEFHGQKISVLLEDYADDPHALEEDIYKQRDEITDSLGHERQALILYGLGYPAYEAAYTYSTVKWNMNGLRTSINNMCTVENFKTDLRGNDLIAIEEHGVIGENESWIITEEEYDPASDKYREDLETGRLTPLVTENGAYYGLRPSFFEHYYGGGQLADSMVWIGSCYGASSPDFINAFINTGAKAVVGHSNSVYSAYNYDMINTVVDKMISGDSCSEAFQEACSVWGENDEQYAIEHLGESTKKDNDRPSYPVLTGDIRWE